VAVIRVPREAARANHQALLVRDHQADLDAELKGVARLALGNALDLRGMQRVQLVLGVALLGADALGTFEQRGQVGDCLGAAGLM